MLTPRQSAGGSYETRDAWQTLAGALVAGANECWNAPHSKKVTRRSCKFAVAFYSEEFIATLSRLARVDAWSIITTGITCKRACCNSQENKP